jgi:hypothetical protein
MHSALLKIIAQLYDFYLTYLLGSWEVVFSHPTSGFDCANMRTMGRSSIHH